MKICQNKCIRDKGRLGLNLHLQNNISHNIMKSRNHITLKFQSVFRIQIEMSLQTDRGVNALKAFV